MAQQVEGFLGGFHGKLGPVVGYSWNGKWVVRSRPRTVNNPQTEAQQAHREEFREQVRLAAAMRQGVVAGMTLAARQVGMTAYNLFVSLNQGCFDDFGQLRIATGPLAPVGFTEMRYEDYRLEVNFEKNPLHMRADRYDGVRLYLYNIDTKKGFLTAPVYRMDGRIALVVPEWLSDGGTVYVYGFVQDSEGRCSESACLGRLGDYESTSQQDYESTSLRANESTSQQDNESTSLQDYESTSQRDYESTSQRDYESTSLRVNESTSLQDHESTRLRVYESTSLQDHESTRLRDS